MTTTNYGFKTNFEYKELAIMTRTLIGVDKYKSYTNFYLLLQHSIACLRRVV